MTRRRLWRWRYPTVLLCFLLAALGVASAGSVTSAGTGTFIDKGSYWQDPVCGTSNMLFKARIWQDTDYQGDSWVFCSNTISDFCWVPYGENSSSALLCGGGYDGDTANDRGSSVKVSAVYGGSSCAVRIYVNRDFGGSAWVTWDPVNDPNTGPVPFNDVFSSIRRTC